MKERDPRTGYLLPTIDECFTLGALAFETGIPFHKPPETIVGDARLAAWRHAWQSSAEIARK